MSCIRNQYSANKILCALVSPITGALVMPRHMDLAHEVAS
uniref:Uncharacterized protein n=1 Tax=Arundo donax TaxID=35708 RepID=A0A0A9H580_ARUDO